MRNLVPDENGLIPYADLIKKPEKGPTDFEKKIAVVAGEFLALNPSEADLEFLRHEDLIDLVRSFTTSVRDCLKGAGINAPYAMKYFREQVLKQLKTPHVLEAPKESSKEEAPTDPALDAVA